MKKHKKIIIAIIVIVLIIFCVMFFIIKSKKAKSFGEFPEGMGEFMKENMEGMKDKTTGKTDKQNKKTTTLNTQAEIKSALTEEVELHASYYLEEIYVEKNEFIARGENILKYTNGTYLKAPYDCYIINLNLPELEEKVLNSHYVELSSSNSLMVTMNVDETNIENISVGQEATIEISSLNKTYKGNITHIASTGNNGKFEIEIEFTNDGDVKLGMTADVSITI